MLIFEGIFIDALTYKGLYIRCVILALVGNTSAQSEIVLVLVSNHLHFSVMYKEQIYVLYRKIRIRC